MSQLELGELLHSSGEVIHLASSEFVDNTFSKIKVPQNLSGAIESRKIEFQKGRYLSKVLLSRFDCYEEVPIGDARQPLWPKGFLGSISHCKKYFVSTVIAESTIFGVGIDVEEIGRIKPDVSKLIRTSDDILKSHLSLDELETLIFSSKEAFYKALYPSVNMFFGFKDAAVISVDKNSFKIQLKRNLSNEHCIGRIYIGRYIVGNDYLVTYIEY